MSETEGLCLNITTPDSISAENKLPVFAFIHGGGFNVGSAMYPQYDLARFVSLSVAEGRQCIAVGLNYRLGAPGLLTSRAMRSKGYAANNALRDQRTALLWIQKHIAGFGGDPENVTLMGESAGGISVCYHLFSKEPLFRRMMSMSGTHLLAPPITSDEAEKNYTGAMKALGLREGDIDGLLAVDAMTMVTKLTQSGFQAVPVLDNDICPTTFSFASTMNGTTDLPGSKWCEAAVIGDCQFDGNIRILSFAGQKEGIARTFCSSILKSLASSPGVAGELLTAYGLSPELDDTEGMFRVLQVANDLNFYLPTLAIAQGFEAHMKTYMYRFNEPNPWDGPWKGHATHILDLCFLLQNFNEHLDDAQKNNAELFAKDVIKFVNGEEPWTRWQSEERIAKVLGPSGKAEVIEDAPEKVGRRSVVLKLGEQIGLDKLNEAFNGFMKPPSLA